MGIVNFGVPQDEVMYLKKKLKLEVFIEGGTYKGDTVKQMSKQFNEVYTIEKSETMYKIAGKNISDLSNVKLLKGDTRDFLSDIISKSDDLLFWLDAHWSGGETYGDTDQCPLLKELEIIFLHEKNMAVLIDDARLFLAPPPSPLDIKQWPTLGDILKVIPQNWDLIEFEDVIYILPKKIIDEFRTYLQKKVTRIWNTHRKKTTLQRILEKLGICR